MNNYPPGLDLTMDREDILTELQQLDADSTLRRIYETFIEGNCPATFEESYSENWGSSDDEEDNWYIISDSMFHLLAESSEKDQQSKLWAQFAILQSVIGPLGSYTIIPYFPTCSISEAQRVFHMICYQWSK